jgi:hypothetical protein
MTTLQCSLAIDLFKNLSVCPSVHQKKMVLKNIVGACSRDRSGTPQWRGFLCGWTRSIAKSPVPMFHRGLPEIISSMLKYRVSIKNPKSQILNSSFPAVSTQTPSSPSLSSQSSSHLPAISLRRKQFRLSLYTSHHQRA